MALSSTASIFTSTFRDIPRVRVGKPSVTINAGMGPAEVQKSCVLDKPSLAMIRMARLGLSARAYHRVLKLSRTIAVLAADEQV